MNSCIFRRVWLLVAVTHATTQLGSDTNTSTFTLNRDEDKLDPIDKLSAIYLNRIISIAANIANMDANVKNILSRAYIWDTVQHHVSAWNDQLKTLDKKIDIISSGQEKLITLDTLLSSFGNVEYKVERALAKLDALQARLDATARPCGDASGAEPPEPAALYREFTTRGVLSTLKIVEHKIDRLQTIVERQDLVKNAPKRTKSGTNSTSSDSNPHTMEMARGRFVIKCTTPPVVEELVKDMASKVDLIYDKIAAEPDGSDDGDEADSLLSVVSFGMDMDQGAEGSADGPPDRLTAKGPVAGHLKADVSLRNFQQIQNKLDHAISTIQRLDKQQSQELAPLRSNLTKCLQNLVNIQDLKEILTNSTAKIETNLKALSNEVWTALNTTRDIISTSEDKVYAITTKPVDVTETTTVETNKHYDWPKINEEFSAKVCSSGSKETVPEVSCAIMEHLAIDLWEPCQYHSSFDLRYCTATGGITVQSRRSAQVNFNQSWSEYRAGFGNFSSGNFWLGNEAIHRLTAAGWDTMRVDLVDFERNTAWAEYADFRILPETESYELRIRGYTGNATDSFSTHNGSKFSTYDMKNDLAPTCCPCAMSYGGGWWFHSCFESNLNGVYHSSGAQDDFRGLIWEKWRAGQSLSETSMTLFRRHRSRSDIPPAEDP